MPGHVGTDIIVNSRRARGLPDPLRMSVAQVAGLIARGMRSALVSAAGCSMMRRRRPARVARPDELGIPDKAPVSAAGSSPPVCRRGPRGDRGHQFPAPDRQES
jgi:hypothetical protein